MPPLILECVRARPDAGELRRLCSACSDWDGLIESAVRRNVAPLVFWALNRACPDAVPAGILAALRNAFLQNVSRNLHFAKELHRLLELFGRAGIQVIPFKGPALAWSLYETPGLRFMSDLDLLVAPCDANRAIDLLTSAGYRRIRPGIGLRFYSNSGQLNLKSAGGRFDVDLHWRAAAAHFNPLDASEIRARLAPIDIAGRPTPAFCPEDLLAFLCVHGAKHGWNSLAAVCDLDRLIAVRRLDWDAILSRAARQGMLRMVSLGLCLARDMLGSSLPPKVSSRIQADARVMALAASIRARFRGGGGWNLPDTLIFRFRLMEDARGRFRFLWHLLQPACADREALRLPESMFPVYYFTRPVRLAWKWCVRPLLNLNRGV